MEIYLAGSRPTRRAPEENFTGTVWQDPIITAPAPARVVCSAASPLSRAHAPLAHTSVRADALRDFGRGPLQTKGEPVREIKAGDVIWIPPGEKHWHGGAPTTGMVHIAMQEALDGKTSDLDGARHRRGIQRRGRLIVR